MRHLQRAHLAVTLRSDRLECLRHRAPGDVGRGLLLRSAPVVDHGRERAPEHLLLDRAPVLPFAPELVLEERASHLVPPDGKERSLVRRRRHRAVPGGQTPREVRAADLPRPIGCERLPSQRASRPQLHLHFRHFGGGPSPLRLEQRRRARNPVGIVEAGNRVGPVASDRLVVAARDPALGRVERVRRPLQFDVAEPGGAGVAPLPPRDPVAAAPDGNRHA